MAAREQRVLAAGLAFVLVSFAANSVMTRYVVRGGLLDPGLATIVRFLAGAASLALLLAWTGGLRSARPTRRSVLPALALGAYAVLISYGYVHIGAAAGTFVFYACVLATLTLAGWLEGAAPAPRAIVGGLVALAGVAVLAVGRVEGTTLLGVALLAGTGISWGAYSALGRRSEDALGFTGANFFALALPLALWLPALLATGAPALSTEGLLVAAFMGAVTTALSYAVWYWALARITRAQAGTYQLAIPVLTGAMAVLLLGEAFSDRLLLAGALVLAGMALATPRGVSGEAPPGRAAAPAPGRGR